MKLFYLLFIFLITGCGFQPLHGMMKDEGQQYIQANLSSIHILPIANRPGQQLRLMLMESLRQPRTPTRPVYTLQVTLENQLTNLGIQGDATASYGKFNGVATYILRDSQTNTVLFQERLRHAVGYDIVDSEYASLKAEQDAQLKVLHQISQGIAQRLTLYFHAQHPNPAKRKKPAS